MDILNQSKEENKKDEFYGSLPRKTKIIEARSLAKFKSENLTFTSMNTPFKLIESKLNESKELNSPLVQVRKSSTKLAELKTIKIR